MIWRFGSLKHRLKKNTQRAARRGSPFVMVCVVHAQPALMAKSVTGVGSANRQPGSACPPRGRIRDRGMVPAGRGDGSQVRFSKFEESSGTFSAGSTVPLPVFPHLSEIIVYEQPFWPEDFRQDISFAVYRDLTCKLQIIRGKKTGDKLG